MDFLSHVANSTLNATETFLRYAKAIPEDKIDWMPSPDSRSVLSIMQEVAHDPRDLSRIFQGQAIEGAGSDAYFDRVDKEKAEWTTLAECERVLLFNVEMLVESLKSFSAENLSLEVVEPSGYLTTFADLAFYQYWNTVWHTGQISYIQTLLGDRQSY